MAWVAIICARAEQMMLHGTQITICRTKVIWLSINKAESLFKSEFCLEKADLPFLNKISNSTELQSEQVEIHASFGIEMASLGILRFSLAEQSCLTCLQPIRIRAANAFSALTFLDWPARRHILQRPVCHLAARNDDNAYHRVVFPTPFKLHDLLLTQHYYYLDVVLWKIWYSFLSAP